MEKIVINIDSRFREISKYPNSEHFVLNLNEQYKNIDFIKMTTIEIPNNFYIFSSARKSNYFMIDDVFGVLTKVTISEGNYSIDELITEINSKILATFGAQLYEIATDDKGGIILGKPGSGTFSVDFSNDNSQYKSLGYHLGFRKTTYDVIDSVIAESLCDVNGENYIFIKINDYGNLIINPVLGIKALAKIVFYQNKGGFTFDNNDDLYAKYIFRQPVNVKRLEIELLDAYGNRIDNRNFDYSLTLEIGQFYKKEEYLNKLNHIF